MTTEQTGVLLMEPYTKSKLKAAWQFVKQKIKKIWQFVMNPRLLLCLALAWLITNGWSYILFAVGTALGIYWMTAVAGAYLAFLWLPISPEKLATIAIAIFLLKRLFPDDQHTLAVLHDMRLKTQAFFREKKQLHHSKKQAKEEAKHPHDLPSSQDDEI